ncbi:hypothetical protein F4859DRAFT_478072 [Xylaria cf. heliscus]|nr:hypothetical protein F4859DRAFT_478072 [Xylaria cf. heliscus]
MFAPVNHLSVHLPSVSLLIFNLSLFSRVGGNLILATYLAPWHSDLEVFGSRLFMCWARSLRLFVSRLVTCVLRDCRRSP